MLMLSTFDLRAVFDVDSTVTYPSIEKCSNCIYLIQDIITLAGLVDEWRSCPDRKHVTEIFMVQRPPRRVYVAPEGDIPR